MNYFFQVFSKTLGFLLAIMFLIVLISLFLFVFGENKKKYFSYLEGNKDSTEIIAILYLNGPIISEPPSFNNYNIFQNLEVIYPSLIKEYLKELEQNNAKGLIISINTPGGGVSATQKIYKLIKDFKEKNDIPIFFHTKDIMTSGGYWVALSGDKIFADYGSIIGSIGVKGPNWLYYNSPTLLSEGLFGKSVESQNGLKLFSNTAGMYKDIFNPFREPTKEEISKLQIMVDDIYE
ncbi:S49 family peptidase, partial [Alphaproteobacteria bacterium]|nr:S49 family peptidase [Alphaproteobacteria bacterium]